MDVLADYAVNFVLSLGALGLLLAGAAGGIYWSRRIGGGGSTRSNEGANNHFKVMADMMRNELEHLVAALKEQTAQLAEQSWALSQLTDAVNRQVERIDRLIESRK